MRLRHFAARKRKRGASLVMVLVSMTILTIMGTLFTTIAMRSYQYSYSCAVSRLITPRHPA